MSELVVEEGTDMGQPQYRKQEHACDDERHGGRPDPRPLESGRAAESKRTPGMVHAQHQAVCAAPHHERPVGAMPEPAKHHDYAEIDISPYGSVAIAAQRNVKIVAQKA